MIPDSVEEILIASVTPKNLERGVLWFQENADAIKKAALANPWWRDNTVSLEKDLVLKPSECVRRLTDFGYERAQSVHGRGLFAVRGGMIEVWPVNSHTPYVIEFIGNSIGEIREREEMKEIVKPRATLSHSHEIARLPEGSFVVHEDHGIGIFRGDTENSENHELGITNYEKENNKILPSNSKFQTPDSIFYVVEYASPRAGAEPDRLYVPIDQKRRLTPYVGFEAPRIHRLGGSVWQTTKRKVKEDTEKLARDLLTLYAAREEVTRPPLMGDFVMEEEIRASFPYQETDDQLRAEIEIFADLEKSKPMDRLLVGDVGFGKTEIALRAAFRAVASGKQVALMSPTTVLAAQHQITFSERFKNLPVRTAMLSRLVLPTQEKEILAGIREGVIDCVIGTHRLLSKDIVFKNLGLVIIDEEQRFGVKQKERFKSIRTEVDVLALSATPIPRTMQFILAKLRDVSLLETPPPDRLPIQTLVLPHSYRLIRGAIGQELERGGQVYFLHNRIETIGRVKEKLEKMQLLSYSYDRNGMIVAQKEAGKPKIGVIHGRMPEREIVGAMEAFRKKEIDILIATTIIENGLDISSANTLIVDDATRLGLAQAHQLRGRIGRGNVKAFAYFLYRPRNLTEKAKERLKALQEYAELGAGYQLALRDLEIRGAGNILGREQSGAVNKVGLNLYYQMLGEAIEEIKLGQSKG